MPNTVVIILNGASSVGKSSTARAIQEIATRPFLHVSMDVFANMMPERMMGHVDGKIVDMSCSENKRVVDIRTGIVMDRTMRGMRHAVAAMAAEDNNLVVDDVMLGRGEAEEYRRLLVFTDLYVIGLFAPLEVLEQRERRRGNREPGLARWQVDRVHVNVKYDFTIDTADITPFQAANNICAACLL